MSTTRMLPVPLTDRELRERGQELAVGLQKITQCELQAKADAKAAKEEIADLKEGALDLARIVTEKKERRPVEIIESFDLEKRVAHEVRVDTGEVVSTRPMTVAEYAEHEQKRLPFGSPKKERATAGKGADLGADEGSPTT